MKSGVVAKLIEKEAPLDLAYSWDNCGFQIGDENSEISKIMLTLDVTPSVVDEAIEKECDMIISHHPMFFDGIKNINYSTGFGQMIKKIIQNNITVYSCHTNMDSAENGINSYLAKLFNLKHIKVVDENEKYKGLGLGRVGDLKEEISIDELCKKTKELLGINALRLVYGGVDKISRIAVASGSCSELIPLAKELGAEAIITADIKYHTALESAEFGINVIDAGHYPTEFMVTKILKEILEKESLELVVSSEKDIFTFV